MIIKGEPGGRARLEWELHKSDTRCTLLSHLAIKCWNFEVDTEKTHLTGLNINRELLEETRRPLSARLEIAVYTQVCCWDERACLTAFDCSLPCCIPHLHFLVTSQFVCLYLVTHTLLSDFPFFLFTNLKPCILNTCSFRPSSETLIPHSFFLQWKMNLWCDKKNEGADPSLLNKRIKFINVWPEFGTLATNHFAEMTNQTNKGSTNMAVELQCVKNDK